ncbi:hypothetical protein WG66_001121 [Moniliophthora roreri]|nr:hypothetical protein WG66_001121 [Moniliophthora roreri]
MKERTRRRRTTERYSFGQMALVLAAVAKTPSSWIRSIPQPPLTSVTTSKVPSTSLDEYDMRTRTNECFVNARSKEQVGKCYDTDGLPCPTKQVLFNKNILCKDNLKHLYALIRCGRRFGRTTKGEATKMLDRVTMENANHVYFAPNPWPMV